MGDSIYKKDPFLLPEFWVDWEIKQEPIDDKWNITVCTVGFLLR